MKPSPSLLEQFLSNRLLTHIVFWIFFVIVQSQVFLYTGSSFKVIVVFTAVILPSVIMAAYLLAYYQVPQLLLKRKYVLFTLSLLVSAYVFTALARILTIFVAEPFLEIQDAIPPLEMLWRILSSPDRLARNYLLSVYLAPATMVIIRLIKQYHNEKQQLEQLEKEKTTSELNFLKAQIHPHFLLNTLNNIYALTLKKSDQAPETVLKLSEMLTYVLYKCNERYVPLSSEIDLIENYISLERIRYRDNFKLSFEKEVQAPETIQIAPLVLLSIVENAFKHGTSGDVSSPEIRIYLQVKEGILDFKVFNTKSEIKQTDEQNYTKGIGSENVKKQLDLIYPNNYEYHVLEKPKSYEVHLQIHLNRKENAYTLLNS